MDKKNILHGLAIIGATMLTLLILSQFPGYFKEKGEVLTGVMYISIFLLADFFLIGIAAGFHWLYSKDYSPIKNIWFFAFFGGITGAMLGEGGSVVMIIPYTLLMLLFALLYRKFTWWKVALSTYLGGILIENVMNRSPLQAPTLLWIAFFTYPYFITKLWERRKEGRWVALLKDLRWAIGGAALLMAIAVYVSRENISPPLIFLGGTLPFIITIGSRIIKGKK